MTIQTTYVSTARTLFKKVAKGVDKKDFIIAQQELKIRQLENRVLQLEPRKRHKVVTSPNLKFATIDDIIRTQISVREHQNVLLDSDDDSILTSTLSHITIEE